MNASRRHLVPARPGFVGIVLMLLVAVATLAGSIGFTLAQPATASAAAALPTRDPLHVRVTSDGIVPATINAIVGQAVVFDNETGAERTITATGGAFDSGPIPAEGAFAVTLSQPGNYAFTSPGDPELSGLLVVGLSGLAAASSAAKVGDVIPDMAPGPVTDLAPQPEYLLNTSRTRLIVLPSATATVGAFNTLLDDNDLTIVGGMQNLKELVVATADPGDHSAVMQAAAALRASNLVSATSFDFEVVEQNIPRPISAPTGDTDPPTTWQWQDPNAAPPADDATWGMRDINAPTAWNLLDTARAAGQPALVTAMELSAGVDHDDLEFSVYDTCNFWCSDQGHANHAQHVMGVIGATYDNTGVDASHTKGIVGVNPLGRTILTVNRTAASDQYNTGLLSQAGLMYTLDKILGQTGAGQRFDGLKAINISLAASAWIPAPAERYKQWQTQYPYNEMTPATNVLCGPNASDDNDPGAATQPCYPGNLDAYRKDFAQLAQAMVPVIRLATDKKVILVKAASNDNHTFCIQRPVPGTGEWKLNPWTCTPGVDEFLDMNVHKMNEFAAARDLMGTTATSLLIVEAHNLARQPALFSQRQGDISAPGEQILSLNENDKYGIMSGTSMASPFVTGAIGYLYSVKPGATWQQVIAAVKDGARTAPGGGTKQLDLFAAEVKLGLLKNALDVNDPSADGSRRLIRDDHGMPIAEDLVSTATPDAWDAQFGSRTSAPDGKIDMRDFRRFRDAWLHTCEEQSAGTQAGAAPSCPPAIFLDGPTKHPKKDGNGDRCNTLSNSGCQAKDGWYSRFDANGDGRLDVYAQAPVAITATGQATTTASQLTDLEVFQRFFETNTANTEGWTKNDLPALLVSADIDLRLGDFWAAGANNVSVTTLVDGVATGPARTFAKPATGPGGGIMTLPVGDMGSKVELVTSATGPDGNPLTAVPFVVPVLLAGDDKVASPCVARLDLTFDTQALLPGQETDVKASVHDCNPASTRPEVENRIVTFGVLAEGDEVPVILGVPGSIMDSKGTAEATLRAGTGTGTFTVWAKLELPGGHVLRGEADVTVTPQIKLSYHWRASLDSFDVEGSTRWNGMPDCSSTGQDYCVDHAHQYVDPGDPTITFDRQGTITATTAGVRLTEEVGGGGGYVTTDFTWTDLATGVVRDDGIKLFSFNIIDSERNRYANHPVPVDMTPVDGEVLVSNLRSLALLGYRSNAWASGYGIDPPGVGMPGDFFLEPRPDGSSIAYAKDFDRVLRFVPDEPAGSDYQWCGTTVRDLTTPPSYYTGDISDWVVGASNMVADTQYDEGDQPLLAGPGEIRFDIEFAASISVGGEPADPALPFCGGSGNLPAAEFRVVNEAPIEEGEAVQFIDESADLDGDIAEYAWDFGGAGASAAQDANFSQGFPDEGTYPVTLTVTDEDGNTASATHDVVVVNAKPTAEFVSSVAVGTANVPMSVHVLVDDPGKEDRRSLKVKLDSSNPAFPDAIVLNRPAGDVKFDLPGLKAGEYPLTVTVTDDGGASATATANLSVTAVPPTPVPQPPLPPVLVDAPGCTAPIPLDADEAELLGRINAQRALVHQPPLIMSSKLTAAAERQSIDMLVNGTVSGTGSDGSTTRTRVNEAGYPAQADVEEWLSTAILIGDVWANLRQDVSATWFGQGMAMIGISRAADDTNVRWSVVVGTVVDCDEEPRGEGSAPVASLTAPDTVEEGITFSVQPTSTDADGDMTMQQISWGDGAVGGIRHRYQDDGTYTITVTTRDLAGHVSTASTEIVVTASAPEVSITPGRLVAGTRGVIAISMIELAAADRPLSVVITSDNPVYIPPAPFTWDMGGYVYAVTPPAPGSFTLTVRVTDRDGATGTATQTFHVDAPPGTPAVAPDNVVLDPAPACATGMEVIGQAAEQLALVNAYRARHGLGALVVVPELTAAAERHAVDMQNHRFFAHEGSDGSSPASRIRDTGYPGAGGENIALRTTTPAEQMAGWIMSPPHHTNILNPTWKAIGIADVNGQDGVLAVNVFGDRVTCPTGDEIAPEPRVLANPDAGKPAGQLGDSGEGPVAPYPAPSRVAPAAVVAEAPAGAGIAEQPEVTALAVTISDRTPTAGQLITIVNRSRDLGLPRSVAMSLPLTQPTLVAADATRRVVVLDPGVFTIGLSGSGYPGIPMAVSIELPVDGEARPPTVVLTQPGDVVSGELVELSATVYEPDGEPAPGRPVRFSIGNLTSTTASDNDGVATATVRADLAAGAWPLRAEVLTDAGDVAAIAERTITIGTNLIPVADAGGQYPVTIGDELTLDASGTYDADGEFVSYFWDLDHDGAFDDAETAAPEIDYVTLQELLCAGLCETGVDYTLTLRVVDPKGGTSEDTATVTFVRDFVVVVSPATITITPGSSNSFVVDVVTTSGFTSPVALSAAGLPAGATAVFAPTSVVPGQRSMLTITLPADVGGLEAIDLSVTGTSGDIVRTASSTVDVVFGLPPRCTTVVSGTVLDAETGLPIAGALVRVDDANTQRIDVNTDGDGAWQVDSASPSTTNQPGPIARRVEAQGYWPADLSATATCGVPLQLVDRLTPVHYVTVRGQVRVGAPDPVNPIEMVPSAAVAPNTKVSLTAGGTKILDNVAVNTDGEFEATVPLAAGNSAQSISVSGEAPNYWKTTVNTSVKDNETKFVMVLLRGKCTGLITGGRVIDASNKPVPGATVIINGKSATAGSDGRYTIDAVVTLATGGLPVSVSISGGAPANRTDLLGTTKSVTMSKCDDVMAVDVILPFKPTPPPNNTHYGSVSGVVTDVDTGLPVVGADVKVGTSSSVKTNADGRFLVPSVSLGSATAADIGMSITKTGYWQESATVRINEGATTDVAKTILAIRYGAVSGVVTDQVTGVPLSGARVIAGNVMVYSDAEGRYTATGVSLGSRNTSRTITTTTTLDGYWKRDISVQVSQDTTVSNNVALLKECATASISGIVVNAETRQPINGAKVQAKDVGTVTTGADGRFTFPSVKMLTGNAPWGVELTASATGFVSQKKTVNVFCGAQIEVGFGSLPPNPGVITGVVTDAASGAPLAGMFVGTGFGGSATTAADGTYRIEGVPTSDNGTPIEWTVSVVPGTLDPHLPASLVVSVLPGATVDASFALELPAPPNEAPTAVLTAPAPVAEGGSVTLDASGSSDPENAALAFAWDLDGDGVYADGVEPVVSLSLPVAGTRTVSVQVTDDAGATAVASVQVVAVNVDPVVDAGGDATLEPTGHLARNGSFADPGADTFTATVDFGEGDGSQQLALDGTSFVLDHNYPAGTYTVTVWVYDGHGGAGQDVFTVTVPQLPPPNKVPTAGDVSVETDSNTAVAVTLTGDDGDGDTLTYALVDAPAVGTLTGSAPALTYVPQAGYVGTVTFTYSVHDGKDLSPPATVTISVVAPPPPPPPPNTAPVAEDAAVSTAYETVVDVALVAGDADGDTLTYAVVDWPAHGSLAGTGAALTYTPVAGFSGTDTFTWRASDGTDVSGLATVTITVAAPPPPPPPAGVELLLSDNSARSANVRPLEGQVLRDGAAMYAFVGPQAQVPSIKKVTFFLDDPQRKNTPFSIEAELAFDFARTGANRNGCRTCADSPALPFESNLLTLGSHTVTAYVEFKDGSTPVVLTSTFEVADTTPHAILVSTRSDRGNAVPLAGATLKDKRYIFLGAAQDAIAGAQYVRFVLDGNKVIDEALIPYDLKATASNGSANPLNTKSLSRGTHTLEAIVQFPEGVTYRYSATFTVTG